MDPEVIEIIEDVPILKKEREFVLGAERTKLTPGTRLQKFDDGGVSILETFRDGVAIIVNVDPGVSKIWERSEYQKEKFPQFISYEAVLSVSLDKKQVTQSREEYKCYRIDKDKFAIPRAIKNCLGIPSPIKRFTDDVFNAPHISFIYNSIIARMFTREVLDSDFDKLKKIIESTIRSVIQNLEMSLNEIKNGITI